MDLSPIADTLGVVAFVLAAARETRSLAYCCIANWPPRNLIPLAIGGYAVVVIAGIGMFASLFIWPDAWRNLAG